MDYKYLNRDLETPLKTALTRGKSVLLLGPRQTGKTTLIKRLSADFSVSLVTPKMRLHYEKNPSALAEEIAALDTTSVPLVIIDEVQKVPPLLDVAQDLIDNKKAQFVLTGSSARKLKTAGSVNLLPGRVVALHLTPLTLKELPAEQQVLSTLLLYGSLPGIVNTANEADKETDLHSYVDIYLEQEIRAEALVRNVGNFARFLELAAAESLAITNFRKLSQEIGIAHTTIAAYYQILEDCLIIERIDPLITQKTRRRLSKSPRYLFFDLGVRRVSAGEGIQLPEQYLGRLFEHFIGLELLRYANLAPAIMNCKIYFWRDLDGPEVDFVVAKDGMYIPVEVKWTTSPQKNDIKHLSVFLAEYSNAKDAFLICRVPHKMKLAENIFALPWQDVVTLL